VDVGAKVSKQLRVIAIVGAESTGKTELARGLAAAIEATHGLHTTWVSEWLRDWCERQGRTPRPDEQWAIAQEQTRRIEQACTTHELVVADTTALMTAVYSELLFNDRSLRGFAKDQQRRYALTLVTGNDLPWAADGLQRDGAHVRDPVRRMVTGLLQEAMVPFEEVSGIGSRRLGQALTRVSQSLGSQAAPARVGAATEPNPNRAGDPSQA
jgi:nicotinamide riboside kinase